MERSTEHTSPPASEPVLARSVVPGARRRRPPATSARLSRGPVPPASRPRHQTARQESLPNFSQKRTPSRPRSKRRVCLLEQKKEVSQTPRHSAARQLTRCVCASDRALLRGRWAGLYVACHVAAARQHARGRRRERSHAVCTTWLRQRRGSVALGAAAAARRVNARHHQRLEVRAAVACAFCLATDCQRLTAPATHLLCCCWSPRCWFFMCAGASVHNASCPTRRRKLDFRNAALHQTTHYAGVTEQTHQRASPALLKVKFTPLCLPAPTASLRLPELSAPLQR